MARDVCARRRARAGRAGVRLACLLAACLLAACGAQGPAGAGALTPAAAQPSPGAALPPTVAEATAPAPSPPPATDAAKVTPLVVSPTAEVPTATLTAQLSATLTAEVTPVPTSDTSFGGIEGAQALALSGGDQPLWAAHSYGMRSFEPEQQHFVAIYTYRDRGWEQLGRVALENADYLDGSGVRQVAISPDRTWIEVQSGVGAHSGCYDLLSFDGTALRDELSHCHDSPDAASIQDVDGDGAPDVVLNNTANYIFCYACGVRLASFDVRRWDGQAFVPVELASLPAGAPAQLRELNNRAVALAQAGFWKDAQATISQTLALGASDPAYRWNVGLISLTGGARQALAADSPYPLLGHLFYGDYPAALDVLRQHPPERLFAAQNNPLVAGTVAEGFEEGLTGAITETTNLALEAQPDLAAAHFLRGWALHLHSPADPAALAEIERAAQLDPQEALFQQSAAFLKKR